MATETHKLGRLDKVDILPTGIRFCSIIAYNTHIYFFSAIIIFRALCSTVHSAWAMRMKVEGGGSKPSAQGQGEPPRAADIAGLEPQFYSPNAGHQSSDSLSRCFFSAAPITEGRWTASFRHPRHILAARPSPGAL